MTPMQRQPMFGQQNVASGQSAGLGSLLPNQMGTPTQQPMNTPMQQPVGSNLLSALGATPQPLGPQGPFNQPMQMPNRFQQQGDRLNQRINAYQQQQYGPQLAQMQAYGDQLRNFQQGTPEFQQIYDQAQQYQQQFAPQMQQAIQDRFGRQMERMRMMQQQFADRMQRQPQRLGMPFQNPQQAMLAQQAAQQQNITPQSNLLGTQLPPNIFSQLSGLQTAPSSLGLGALAPSIANS